jgi:hypothetical protein
VDIISDDLRRGPSCTTHSVELPRSSGTGRDPRCTWRRLRRSSGRLRQQPD